MGKLFWAGFLLAAIGAVGLFVTAVLAGCVKELADIEKEMMKSDGALPGEPEYMREFRVPEASSDKMRDPLLALSIGAKYFGPALVIGAIILWFAI